MGRGAGAEQLLTGVSTARGAATAVQPTPVPATRSQVNPVLDNIGKPKFGGCVLQDGDRFYADASRSSLPLTVPSGRLKDKIVFPRPIPPELLVPAGVVWAELACSSLAPIGTAREISERLARRGLHKKALGGRDEKPLTDEELRELFFELRGVLGWALTSRASEDGRIGYGFARSREDLEADMAQRDSRLEAAGRAGVGAKRVIERHDAGEPWGAWRNSWHGAAWGAADLEVARALIKEMDLGRAGGKELCATARAADPRERAWGDGSLRNLINRLRHVGVPIAATSGRPAGYWIEDDPAEFRAWFRRFQHRHKELACGRDELELAAKVWFPKDGKERSERNEILRRQRPISQEMRERLHRVHETEAERRGAAANRKQGRMDTAKIKLKQHVEHPDFPAARHQILELGNKGTPVQQELIEEFKDLAYEAKHGKKPRKKSKELGGAAKSPSSGRRGNSRRPYLSQPPSGSDLSVVPTKAPW